MIYLEPFAGHAEIRAYFDKVVSIVPPDLKFVVEDITDGDPRKVGVKWCAAALFGAIVNRDIASRGPACVRQACGGEWRRVSLLAGRKLLRDQ